MWSKTFAGFFLGLFISMSIVLNLNLLIPLKIDTLLISGLIIAFPLWAAVQVWCYATPSRKTAWLRGLKVLVPSVILNIILLYSR